MTRRLLRKRLAYLLCTFLASNLLFSSPPLQPWLDSNEETQNVTFNSLKLQINYQLHTLQRHADVCKDKRVLVLVVSAPANEQVRTQIRNSWAGKQAVPHDYVVRFVVGAQFDYNTEMDLYVEKHEKGDLIRYTIEDLYDNLVFKTHAVFAWQQQYCSDVRFVLKVDDDTIVDLSRIDKFIKNDFTLTLANEDSNQIFCKIYHGAKPYRTPWHKRFTSHSVHNQTAFPKYGCGNVYLLTSSAVRQLLLVMPNHPLIQSEDLYFTGIVAGQGNVSLRSSEVFCSIDNLPSPFCRNGNDPMRATRCNVPYERIEEEFRSLVVGECNSVTSRCKFITLVSAVVHVLWLHLVI